MKTADISCTRPPSPYPALVLAEALHQAADTALQETATNIDIKALALRPLPD